MRIECEKTLERFRRARRCEACGKASRHGLDPHHALYKRGLGGGSRLDIPLNLVSLCRWPCHHHAEQGIITRQQMLAVIAKREGVSEIFVDSFLKRVRRTPKTTKAEILAKLEEVTVIDIANDAIFYECLLKQMPDE